MDLVITIVLIGIPLSYSLNISIAGPTYIQPGVPYKLTCTVSESVNYRKTNYRIWMPATIKKAFTIFFSNENCQYVMSGLQNCTVDICSCDEDGLATHWTYQPPNNLSSNVMFECFSTDSSNNLQSSSTETAILPHGPKEMYINPYNASITANIGETLNPISCTAICDPTCQIKWITPDNTEVYNSTLYLEDLRINNHGTYVCYAANEYGNNSIEMYLTVNFAPTLVSLSPETEYYNVTEDDTLNAVNCSAKCRPLCTVAWFGPKDEKLPGNFLNLTMVNRNQTGSYRCHASNYLGNVTSSPLFVNVQYGPGKSVKFEPTNTSIIKVREEAINPITCLAKCNPPCKFQWRMPDGTVLNGSVLEIQSLKEEHHGNFTCTAENGIGERKIKQLYITVNYAPFLVNLSPETKYYNVTEDDILPTVNCSANCRPLCTVAWFGPNDERLSGNFLNLTKVKRNQTGSYRCHATNYLGNSTSFDVFVNVQYQAVVEDVNINTTSTGVRENTTVILTCEFEGNPKPAIEWFRNNDAIRASKEKNQKSFLLLGTVQCEHTGNYSCRASNQLGNSSKDQELFVLCNPRNSSFLQDQIPIKESNGVLDITVRIISYPAPQSVSWFFSKIDSAKNKTVNSTYTTSSYGLYRHVFNLHYSKVTESEYGLYYFFVSNTIIPSYSHVFNVFPERRPDSPQNVTAICNVMATSVVVSWKSGNNGGQPQTFSVWFKINNNESQEFTKVKTEKADPGWNMFESMVVDNLLPNKPYIMYVNSSNVIGSSVSKCIECNTSSVSTTKQDSGIISIGAGTGVGLAVIIFAVIVGVYHWRRQTNKQKENKEALLNRKKMKRNSICENVNDGLKDNILYESAGGDFKLKESQRSFDALVKKTDVTGKQQETTLYAEVQKKTNFTDAVKNKWNIREEDVGQSKDVYASVSKEKSNKTPMLTKTNKDGLVYADLVFNANSKGRRFIIHGIDNRTNYADIDLNLKADPEPDEECGKNEEKENTNSS